MIHEQGFSSAFMLKMHVLNLWMESLYEKKKMKKNVTKREIIIPNYLSLTL